MNAGSFTRKIRGAYQEVAGLITLGGWLAWFGVDHVWRKLTGRRSWVDETFSDLAFNFEERDIAKPYDSPGSLNEAKRNGRQDDEGDE